MANNVKIEFVKTYATPENAERAIEKVLGKGHKDEPSELRYMIVPVVEEGGVRYGVLFVGMQSLQYGIHFHFNCVA